MPETPSRYAREKLSPMSRAFVLEYKLAIRADDKRLAHAARRPPFGYTQIPPARPHRHEAECLEAQCETKCRALSAECRPPIAARRGIPAPQGAILLSGPTAPGLFPSRIQPGANNPAGLFPVEDLSRAQDAVCEPQRAESTTRGITYRQQQTSRKTQGRGIRERAAYR